MTLKLKRMEGWNYCYYLAATGTPKIKIKSGGKQRQKRKTESLSAIQAIIRANSALTRATIFSLGLSQSG